MSISGISSSSPPAIQHAQPPTVKRDDGDGDNDATEAKAAAATATRSTRALDTTA
ncbi:hypothetical protein [Limobrevibacterium gyesilva]|uniref:Uncharacterized protein n=1 Tax=Limobrevibacterium gyesilva TaxID=2991712 RepID=A0AA41YJX8_9PROT|nr:hypothetical protein [Limobrevibacterium gyesilva]MCW3475139.1 hypothetical protein [Limobrevibacterium gyesilva]